SSQPQRLRKALHGERRVSVNVPIARFAHLAGRRHQSLRRIEFAEQAVAHVGMRNPHSFSSDVCATSSRISAIEIAGKARTNRKSSVTNNPMVPTNVL